MSQPSPSKPTTLKLNAAQTQAVTYDQGPLVVLAGPGTGKTRVIVHRIAHLIQQRSVEPESILALTFTVKAATEMRTRLAELLTGPIADRLSVSTFHGLGVRLINRFPDALRMSTSTQLIDSAQRKDLLRELITTHKLLRVEAGLGLDALADIAAGALEEFWNHHVEPARVTAYAKPRLAELNSRPADQKKTDAFIADFTRASRLLDLARLAELFDSACRARGWMSYGDLIALPIRLLRDHSGPAAIIRSQYTHIVVDEFQDVNAAQIELLRHLAPPGRSAPALAPTATPAPSRAARRAPAPPRAAHSLFDIVPDESTEPHEPDESGVSASPAEPAAPSRTSGPDICVVGDDDQSIYEFRGADDRAFAKFSAIYPGHQTIKLTENYRSGQAVISTANHIITKAGDNRYAPGKLIERPRKPDADPDRSLVEAIKLPDDKDDGDAIAAMILTDRVRHPERPFRDYAVLARSAGDIDRVASALTVEGIPFVRRREGGVQDDEGVQDLLAWARLLVDGTAAYAARRILIRPPFATPAAALSVWEKHYNALRTHFEAGKEGAVNPGSFPDFLASWRDSGQQPNHAAADRFITLYRELREIALARRADETLFRIVTLADIAHADLLGGIDRAARVNALVTVLRFARARQPRLKQPGDLGAFIAYYDDLNPKDQGFADDGDQIDAPAETPGAEGEESNAVQLLTAHSSKGLEFDTVFVTRASKDGFNKARADDDDDVLPTELLDTTTITNLAGAPMPVLAPKARAEAEARRLFYVACTRAKRRLVVLARFNKKPGDSLNFFDELVRDPDASKFVTVRDLTDVLSAAAAASVGPAARGEIQKVAPDLAPLRTRRDIIAATRSAERRNAALSLDAADRAEAGFDTISNATDSLGAAASKLAITAHFERHNAPPAWLAALGPNDELVRFAVNLAVALKDRVHPAGAMPLKALTPPLKLSYSLIEAYHRCAACLYVKKVLGLQEPSSQHMSLGQSAHEALEQFFKRYQIADAEGLPLPTLADLHKLGREAFFRQCAVDAAVRPEDIDQLLSQLTTAFTTLHSPDSSILELEKNIEFPYECEGRRHTMTAKIDRIDQGQDGVLHIIDYKTGHPTKARLEPKEDDLQLGIYAMAVEHFMPDFAGGTVEYWLLASGQRGSIEIGKLRQDKIKKKIDEAIIGMLGGKWPKGGEFGCSGACALLGL